MTRVLVLYYSLYGHVHALAGEAAAGVAENGCQALVRRVPETLTPEVLQALGAAAFQKEFSQVATVTLKDLEEADGILFGTPTRFGNMCGQMRQFLDSTGQLWAKGALVGKPGAVFVSTSTQHGGQETTITSFHTTLLHHGMVIVGLPYTFQAQSKTDLVEGNSPYGASTIAGGRGERTPTDAEREAARFLGGRVAEIAKRLRG